MDLTEFVTARLDEEQAAAQAASPGPWHVNAESDEVLAVDDITVADGFALSGPQLRATTAHIARHDPARVLAQVAAMRAIVESHQPDRAADSWYWLERECAECHHRWHMWVPDRSPTEIGPERGCPTVRHLASVWFSHPAYDPAWSPWGE